MPKAWDQRTSEWINLDDHERRYHFKQWRDVKRSTIEFERLCREKIASSALVVDLGSGAGASTAYLAGRHPSTKFLGVEYSSALTRAAQRIAKARSIENLEFQQGDWLQFETSYKVDGVISLQTLSWLPECDTPMLQIFNRIRPNWIAITSLFYEGNITAWIEIEEHDRQIKKFYNVYSLPSFSRLAESAGYKITTAQPFVIDIDIERPSDPSIMGSFTRNMVSERGEVERMLFTGPIITNWYCVLLERDPTSLGYTANSIG